MLLALVCFTWGRSSAGVFPDDFKPNPTRVNKYALVVSVENYSELSKVDNALNDGMTVHSALLKAGFSFVRFLHDPDNSDVVLDAIDELVLQSNARAQPAVLTFYFAGHGFQTDRANYLVLSGARRDALIDDSLPLSTVLGRLSPNKFTLGIVFLDACRTVRYLDEDNSHTPLQKNGMPGFGSPEENGISVVGMAASANFAAASIGRSHPENSPYSWALSEHVQKPSRSLDKVFDYIYSYVVQDTLGRQSPVQNKRAGTSGFFMRPGATEDAIEDAMWQQVLAQGARRNCIEDYIRRHPGGRYTNEAMRLSMEAGPVARDEPVCILESSEGVE